MYNNQLNDIVLQAIIHKITKFDLDEMYNEYVDSRIVEIMKEKVADYNDLGKYDMADVKLYRDMDKLHKQKYLEILYSNPCGFKSMAEILPMLKKLCLGGEDYE